MTPVDHFHTPLKYPKTPIATPLDMRVSTYIYVLFHPFLLLKDFSICKNRHNGLRVLERIYEYSRATTSD